MGDGDKVGDGDADGACPDTYCTKSVTAGPPAHVLVPMTMYPARESPPVDVYNE